MRNQEQQKLRQLAESYNVDPSKFDFENQKFQDIKREILKAANVKTEATEHQQALIWDMMAAEYDATKFDEKVFHAEGNKILLQNCLVLSFSRREFSFALKFLLAKYKANMTTRTKKIIEVNKHLQNKIMVLWFIGSKAATNAIIDEMHRHNLRPRVMRDSYLRCDFVHYAHGQIYNMKQKDFEELQQTHTLTAKQTVLR